MLDVEEKYREYASSGLVFAYAVVTTAVVFTISSLWQPSSSVKYAITCAIFGLQYIQGVYFGMTRQKALSWHPERTLKVRLTQTALNCVFVTVGLLLSMWFWCWNW